MSKLILNIGLAPSTNTSRTEAIARVEVLAALRGAGFFVTAYANAQSLTEETAIVTVDTEHVHPSRLIGALHCVSLALAQDCIAAFNPETQQGTLVGPDAAKWGEFNADYFLFPEHAQTLQQAA